MLTKCMFTRLLKVCIIKNEVIKMELSLPRKLYLLFSVAAIVALFFLLVPKFDDNTYADFSYKINDDNESVSITGFTGSNKNIEIPEAIDGYKVTSIADHAFANMDKLKKVTVGKNVEVIGQYAFDNCVSLTEVTLSQGVREIGHSAFYGCSLLRRIELPEGLEVIDDYAFYSCIRLESIKIPASCIKIGTEAFAACESLTMDCSKNSMAYEIAKSYNIPTDYYESEDYLFLKVLILTVVFGAITLVLVIVLPKIIKKTKKSEKIS